MLRDMAANDGRHGTRYKGIQMEIPKLGQPAPDFAAVDQNESPASLSGLRGDDLLVLVFYRGHWCPFCRRQLAKLQGNLGRIRQRGARLVAVAIDAPDFSRRLAEELGLEFPILSDPDSTIVDAYGIRNRLLGVRSGVPHPAVFVIDRQGLVRFAEVRHNFRLRIAPSRILRELERLSGVPAIS
jgi:peroxiredoxin